MGLPLSVPTPLDYFDALVRDDAGFPLLEAAASLAQDAYPQLDLQQVLAEVDALLLRLRRRLPADAPALHRLQLLNHFFFDELHFGGNVNHYDDPDNSYLHRVLERRCGIPVSLAVLWLELAQGVGLAAQGVGFPGHFLVRVRLPQGHAVVDPFGGGFLSSEALQERLASWRAGRGLPPAGEGELAHYLQPLPERAIIARMLSNLKEIHRVQGDWRRLVAIGDRLLVLLPLAWDEYRDRGLAQAELGQLAAAVRDLEVYLARAGAREDRSTITQRLAQLRRALS